MSGMATSSYIPAGVRAALAGQHLMQYVSIFGYNPDVDATSADEDLWNGGGLYTGFPTGAAEPLRITSSDAADTSNGTGARTIRIFGRNAAGERVTEVVTLNGTTPVVTASTWTRMNFARIVTAGAGQANAGTITVQHNVTTANVFAVMPAGQSRTKVGAFTIPSDRQGVLTGYRASCSNNGGAGTAARQRVSLYIRESGVWEDLRSVWTQNTAGVSAVSLDGGIVLPPGTDIVMRAESGASADNLAVTGSLDLFLVPL